MNKEISFEKAVELLQEAEKSGISIRSAVSEIYSKYKVQQRNNPSKHYSQNGLRDVYSELKLDKADKAAPVSDADIVIEELFRKKENGKLNDLKRKYEALLREYELSEARLEAALNIRESVETEVLQPLESGGKDESTAIIGLSDWHFEETVEKSTINGINEYTLKIAEKRFFNCIQNSMKLVKKERHTDNVNQLVLWLGGDFITGYIHEELIEGNGLSPTQATRFTKKLIASAIEFYLKHGKFEKIIIPTSYGNHGRTTKKIHAATGYKNSYEWMMYHDLADMFASECKVKFIINNGIFTYVDIYGKRNRFWHGDNIRFMGGIGGLTIPLRKAIMEADRQTKADYNFLGHFHNFFEATSNCLVNGSGIGFGAYAQRIGASPEQPQQFFKTLNKKHGYTSKYPILCV